MYSGTPTELPIEPTDEERMKMAAEAVAQTLDYLDALGIRLVMDSPFPSPKNGMAVNKAAVRLKLKDPNEEPNDELPGSQLRDFLASVS